MTKLQWGVLGLLTIAVVAVFVMLWVQVEPVIFAEVPEESAVAESELIISEPALSSPTPTPTPTPSVPATVAAQHTPTQKAPAPTPTSTRTPALIPFLSDYLQNRTYAEIAEARPWINDSVNVWQYTEELGGVSLWDYFANRRGQGYDEDWDSPRHGWLDDQGKWQTYRREIVQDASGLNFLSYVIVDRPGPGVVDKMVFTQYFGDGKRVDTNRDWAEWSFLNYLGKIRIEVDDRIAYDVPIQDWFSGQALCLPPELAKLFFWRYRDFGSVGSIVPIPYQKHIKISLYSGSDKPMWFTFTGVTLPQGTRVNPLTGCLDSGTQGMINALAPNVTRPESFLGQLDQSNPAPDVAPVVITSKALAVPFGIDFQGAGTIVALQFRVPRNYDVTALRLKITYGNDVGVDMPLIAFFGDQDRLVKHRSTPTGIVDDPADPNSYLFYCNYPLPYQNGMVVEITTRSKPVVIRTTYARSAEVKQTQFRVRYDDLKSHPILQSLGPDYTVTLPGNGKLVGMVLATRDYAFDAKKIPGPPPQVFPGTIVFPMGYIESNVTLKDGNGATRVYNGLEDFADGGYAFDSDKGIGANNLPFAGVLAFKWAPPEQGYFTIFRYWNDFSAFRFKQGLTLSFQHGTWNNNFSLRYGLTAFYYAEVK